MAVKKFSNSTIILPKNAEHHPLSAPTGDDVQLEFDIRDGDDDSKVHLSCSYCCADIQLPSLCLQLQEKNCCFKLKNAVCPACAEHLGRDVIEHLTVHSSHLIKRKTTENHTLGRNNPAILGTELQDLTSLTVADFCNIHTYQGVQAVADFCNIHTNIKNNASDDSTPDPLLSPFICNVHVPNAKSVLEVSHSLAVAATASSDTVDVRYDKELDHDTLERIRMSMFMQQILLSTIL